MHTSVMTSDNSTNPGSRSRRADVLLCAVVAVAVALAIGGVVDDAGSLPANAVASVNGQTLSRAELDPLLRRLGDQLGHAPDPSEREEVIARLVDEELLLQQGLALGLARADARLRSQLVQEVIRQAVAAGSAAPVEESELADFVERNAGYFRRPDTFRIERRVFTDQREADRAAAGDDAAFARGQRDPALPATPLAEARWRDYLGSSLAARAVALPVGGSIGEPTASGGVSVLRLLARDSGGFPALAEIRPQVEAEFRRRRDEETLARYVARLRKDARVITESGTSSR